MRHELARIATPSGDNVGVGTLKDGKEEER